LVLLQSASAALAQAHPPPPSRDDDVVVVTARRREEEVQDVPVAVSVVSGASLQATGNNNVGKLQQLLPSFQFYSTNPRNSAVNIRGLGAPFGLTNDGIEQGVGLYMDQVYYSRVASATFDFIDIDRLEVLRGPQGTLYGKNTTAGAVNITTRKPSFTHEGRAELSLGNLGYFQGKASISGPLTEDTVAVRLGITATKRDGTIFNVATQQDVNELDNLGLRAQVLWRAAGNLDLTLTGDYSRQNPSCCAQIFARVGTTQRPLNRQYAALAAAFGYAPPSTDPFDRLTDLDTPLRAKQELGGLSVLAEWDLGPGTFTSVSAWRYWNWAPSNDRDFIGLPVTTYSANPSRQRQWTQEFRYASNGKNRLDYVFGLFAFHQTIQTDGLQVQGPAASRWLLNPTSANANNPAVLDGLTSRNQIDFSNTSLAAFGQVTWRVTDRLRMQPGLRLNYDRKRGSYVATVTTASGSTLLNADQRGVLAPQSYAPRFSDWNLSGDLTLSYDVAPDVLAYAIYAKSFKSGGINLSGLPLDASSQPILSAATVKPEKVDHYEVGLKTELLDRKATLNLSGFWTDIRDYQATVTNGQLGVLRGYLANAGKVRVRGVEVDFSAKPSERFTLYANGAFTDARYVRFVDAPCPPELAGGTNSPPNCDISGQWLPGVSRWAASYGAEYNVAARFLAREGRAYLGFDGSYRSKFSSNPSRSAYTDVNGYALSNFRLGFRTEDSRWNGFGWVRNAFDVNYFELLATQSGNTGLVLGQPGEPRTYGVTLSTRF
jgi:iron complex outermembrane receptor protein